MSLENWTVWKLSDSLNVDNNFNWTYLFHWILSNFCNFNDLEGEPAFDINTIKANYCLCDISTQQGKFKSGLWKSLYTNTFYWSYSMKILTIVAFNF